MQLLFTPCDILDVTWPQKQNSDSVWVSLAALGSCQLHLDNVYLLMSTIQPLLQQTTNIWKIPEQTDMTCSGVLLQLCSRPRPSILLHADQFQDLVQVLAVLCSCFARKQPKKEQKRKLLDCCIPLRFRTSAVHRACEVRDQAPTRHRQ